ESTVRSKLSDSTPPTFSSPTAMTCGNPVQFERLNVSRSALAAGTPGTIDSNTSDPGQVASRDGHRTGVAAAMFIWMLPERQSTKFHHAGSTPPEATTSTTPATPPLMVTASGTS